MFGWANHEDAFLLIALTVLLAFLAGLNISEWLDPITTRVGCASC